MEKIDIKCLSYEELEKELLQMGEKTFRVKQVYDWIHCKLASSFDEMTNLSKDLRDKLKEQFSLVVLEPMEILTSKIDGTQKYLFKLNDNNIIESVLMKYKYGNSVCISTQVGCRMGCKFCASTLNGLVRNLTTSEMLEEIYRIQNITNERVSNIVLMGSGEPFDNYDNVMRFIDIISNEKGLNISQRNITISTCGLVPQIVAFADRNYACTLAISLHASEDDTRKQLMPIAKKYSINQVMEACKYFFEHTKRRLTFEYSLVAGVNDTEEEAKRLADILRNINCHVNLIPVNPIKERDYEQSQKADIYVFKNILEKSKISVTIRREMGRDIQGACGQLRQSYIEEHSEYVK